MKRIQIVLIMWISSSLMGCSSWWAKDDDADNPFKGMSSKALYLDAKKSLRNRQYTSASKRLEALENMYPFSQYAESAQLLLIYAYYKDAEFVAASAEADHFIRLYPRSSHVDYAYYMKGLADFQQPRTALGKIFPMNEAWRDPGTQLQAYKDFQAFTDKFPQSVYYQDALHRLIHLRNQFAERELNNARYYFVRKMYVAASQRAAYVVKTYPQSPSTKEALLILYRSYQALHLQEKKQETQAIYEATFHESIKNDDTTVESHENW